MPGRITFLGRDVTRMPAMDRVRMGVGRSFQIPQPFEGLTVFENLLTAAAYGRGKTEAQVADDCAAILRDTELLRPREPARRDAVSLLDRKRLELARAMATGPELLLLDEIAGGLTEGECQALVATIKGAPCQGHHDHLDRACPACAELGGRTASGARFRARHRHRRPGRDHGLERGARDLSWDGGLSRCWKPAALTASYGQFKALFGVDLTVGAGECVAIIGANGAGKTTLLRSITGVLQNAPDMVLHKGQPIGALPADQVLQRGIAMVPEGRKLFPSLSVEENLLIGGQVRAATGAGRWRKSTPCSRS